ncbi:MAG: 16S rRNA (cytosine(1402)-N(4))-methyltransferase RsmH [Verrucomicrobiota bacterium]
MSHTPVMLKEVIDVLQPEEGKVFVDGTFGCGGHTVGLLEKGASVIALDQDPDAVRRGKKMEGDWGGRLKVEHGNFREWERVGEVDGALLDLGVSSTQLDEGARGFSVRRDGPLDMRMDSSQGVTAADVVNGKSERELEMIFRTYGEERASRRIAKAIAQSRVQAPFESTLQLAALVERMAGGGSRKKGIHPATRVFQALRIFVNDELHALKEALEALRFMLKPGARMAVISFHSLEDRMVKQFIARCSQSEIRAEGMAFGHKNPDYFLKKLGDWASSPEEIAQNPRARSARLRAAERVDYVA